MLPARPNDLQALELLNHLLLGPPAFEALNEGVKQGSKEQQPQQLPPPQQFGSLPIVGEAVSGSSSLDSFLPAAGHGLGLTVCSCILQTPLALPCYFCLPTPHQTALVFSYGSSHSCLEQMLWLVIVTN